MSKKFVNFECLEVTQYIYTKLNKYGSYSVQVYGSSDSDYYCKHWIPTSLSFVFRSWQICWAQRAAAMTSIWHIDFEHISLIISVLSSMWIGTSLSGFKIRKDSQYSHPQQLSRGTQQCCQRLDWNDDGSSKASIAPVHTHFFAKGDSIMRSPKVRMMISTKRVFLVADTRWASGSERRVHEDSASEWALLRTWSVVRLTHFELFPGRSEENCKSRYT